MTAETAPSAELAELLQRTQVLMRSLDEHGPAEVGRLLKPRARSDEYQRAVEALFVLQIAARHQHPAVGLLEMLGAEERPGGAAYRPDSMFGNVIAELKQSGAARKVSVSMPEDLTAAVQRRVGRGKFSQYVTEAVTRQLQLDLIAELSGLLTAEHGPVPEESLAQARAAWPEGD
jgi:Arc/MetJ-type ribon-helix-helix transcriptional regulator